MHCVIESMLAAITLLTVSLNAVTQLLLDGAITRPLFGHASTLLPKWDEDFSIVLLRLGTASLEATSVAGLGNEVSNVAATRALGVDETLVEYGSIELTRFGATSISNAVQIDGKRLRVKHGFGNEIRNIKAGTPLDGELFIDGAWYRELGWFGLGIVKCAKGIWRTLWGIIKQRHLPRFAARPPIQPEMGPEENIPEDEAIDDYQRFLRGEDVSDDGEDFEPPSPSRPAWISRTPSSLSESGEGEEDGEAPTTETVDLYADLTTTAESSALMLAHITDTSRLPLTRRRYRQLIDDRPTAPADEDTLPLMIRQRLANGGHQLSALDEARRNCVICTVEPRDIICWPCR